MWCQNNNLNEFFHETFTKVCEVLAAQEKLGSYLFLNCKSRGDLQDPEICVQIYVFQDG